MAAGVSCPRHRDIGEVCGVEEERGGQTMHGAVGKEEMARSSSNIIEKGRNSSSHIVGSQEGA